MAQPYGGESAFRDPLRRGTGDGQKTPTVLEELLDTVLVKFKKRCPDVPVQLERRRTLL